MRRGTKSLILALVAGWLVVGPGCRRSDSTEKVFSVRGVVRGPFDAKDSSILIEHEPIEGFMPAMTMPFYTRPSEAGGLSEGDRVEFEFLVGETSQARKFRKLGRETSRATEPGDRTIPKIDRVREGDPVPSFSLIDQDGRPFRNEDVLGRLTVLTFVFTRCPVPEFCPLLGKKFQTLQNKLPSLAGEFPNLQLISVTIDPEHDRPAELRAYGQSLGADFRRWRFITGDVEQIHSLTRSFAVRTERNGETLDHSLATVLIDSTGHVASIWRGNLWKPEEVLAALPPPTRAPGSQP